MLLQGAEEALGVKAALGHLDFVPMSEPMLRGVKPAKHWAPRRQREGGKERVGRCVRSDSLSVL